MLEIRLNNEPLDLPAGFAVEVEDTNPVFNERGSQSWPATVPATPANQRLLGFPARIDAGEDPNRPERVAVVSDGAYIRRGLVNVTSAGMSEGITFNVGFDNSTAYNKWTERKLSELSGLPVMSLSVSGWVNRLTEIYQSANPATEPLAVFPLAIGNETFEQDGTTKIYWEILNAPTSTGTMSQPTKVKRVIDGAVTEVTVPAGYCVSPFLRVWKVLELAFADLDLNIVDNFFKTDKELNRLVVLNNVADAICNGTLRYADLMPDCTVGEFLNALWVRFGLVYNINFDTQKATIRLLRDIIAEPPGKEMVFVSAGHELINYEKRQYVKLSAKTSLHAAEPATERFEDFIKGLDLSQLHEGSNVASWKYNKDGNAGDAGWDGDECYWEDDERFDPWEPDIEPPEIEWPDPDDDRDDGRDDYDDREEPIMSARSQATPAATEVATGSQGTFLAREFETDQWFKLDATNNEVKEESSPFFNWDPQTPDLEPLELSSDDECIPIDDNVKTVGLNVGNDFNGTCPLYITGARHYHSYIKGSTNEKQTGNETPLAFLLAYTFGGKTIGRNNAGAGTGVQLTMEDGSRPMLSLFFQFRDGLFAKFWAKYDEILRHGNRSVEAPAVIPKGELQNIELLKPVTFRGIKCLIDTLSYQLPTAKDIACNMKFRTLATQGKYDIKTEQNIPYFSVAARHLEWCLVWEVYGNRLLEGYNYKKQAIQKFREDTGYQNHTDEDGNYWTLDPYGAKPKSIARGDLIWQNDPKIAAPNGAGADRILDYPALLTYDIFELYDTAPQGMPHEYTLGDSPLGQVTITVYYKVKIASRWIYD